MSDEGRWGFKQSLQWIGLGFPVGLALLMMSNSIYSWVMDGHLGSKVTSDILAAVSL